uniref:Secreted protein n=1 Tax=Steinernema glaseri TaxID=37863 RepID=A0A1I7YBG6_9BILA
MLSDLEVPIYSVFALLSLGLVLLLIGIVLRFGLSRPRSLLWRQELWKPPSFVPEFRFPSISTIVSLPDIPQIIVDDPPDYEEARASPCPSYEDVVACDGTRSSIELLAVIP